MSNQRYDMRGVSASKEDVHNAIKKIDKGIFPKAFCKIIPDILGGDPDYCNIMHADGAGTKSSLAYLYWKETGDLSVWKGVAQDAVVMNIDDLLCVGATDNILLSSTIGRNKNLIPGEVISAIINGTQDFLDELNRLGMNIISTGGDNVTPSSATLVFLHNGQELERKELTLDTGEGEGSYEATISGLAFSTPKLEEDHQLDLELVITLSDGSSLSYDGCSWFVTDGNLNPVMG